MLERCVDHHRAVYALTVLDAWSIPAVNRQTVVETYGNRLLTSMALMDHGVPTPAVRVAFTPESALEAMEELGYPVVMKPVEGPKEQLIARIQDKYTAHTVLEHKRILGTYHHSIFYIQKYIEAPGHDIRAYVIGDETVAAVSVLTNHWISPVDEGGLVRNYPVTADLNDIAVRASNAVGGGVMAVDMIQTRRGWFVVEMGQAADLTEASDITGVNIPGKVIDHVLSTIHTGGGSA
jgi:[lysine-biosynthesis-protein LysW]--L-2-aminoadipate ligase